MSNTGQFYKNKAVKTITLATVVHFWYACLYLIEKLNIVLDIIQSDLSEQREFKHSINLASFSWSNSYIQFLFESRFSCRVFKSTGWIWELSVRSRLILSCRTGARNPAYSSPEGTFIATVTYFVFYSESIHQNITRGARKRFFILLFFNFYPEQAQLR